MRPESVGNAIVRARGMSDVAMAVGLDADFRTEPLGVGVEGLAAAVAEVRGGKHAIAGVMNLGRFGDHAFAVVRVTEKLLVENPELRGRVEIGDTLVHDNGFAGAVEGRWIFGDAIDEWVQAAGVGVGDVDAIVFDSPRDPELPLHGRRPLGLGQGRMIGARPDAPDGGRDPDAPDQPEPPAKVLQGRIVTGENIGEAEPEAPRAENDGPFVYRPLLSDADFEALPLERKHEVALAELSATALMFDTREKAVEFARRYWSEPYPDPVRDSLAWIKGAVAQSPLGYTAADDYLTGTPEERSADEDGAGHVRRADETMHHNRSDRDLFLTIPFLSDGQGGPGVFWNPGFSAADIGHIPSNRFDFVDLGVFLAPKGTRMLWVESVTGIPEIALGHGFTRVVTRSFTDGDQTIEYGYLLPDAGEVTEPRQLTGGPAGGPSTPELPGVDRPQIGAGSTRPGLPASGLAPFGGGHPRAGARFDPTGRVTPNAFGGDDLSAHAHRGPGPGAGCCENCSGTGVVDRPPPSRPWCCPSRWPCGAATPSSKRGNSVID